MPGGAGELGARLLALREARVWSRAKLARELRKAADEPLARDLNRMIWAWENGRHAPSPLYMRAYRQVFPELADPNGAAPPPATGPAAILDRARRVTALHVDALKSGDAELAEMADVLLTLQRQVDAAALRLEQAIEARRREEAGG